VPRVAARVTIVCHGSTAATRSTAFPVDEPLEPAAEAAAARLADRLRLPPGGQALTGPALRCRQTAQQLRLAATVEPELADWDLGTWAGRTLDDLSAESPADVQAWIGDPGFTPPGGEPLRAMLHRVGRWLDATDRPARVIAVTHSAVIRAAIMHTLRTPDDSFWRIDVSPLAVVELRGRPGRWSLHA
jgi:broad specificity phosphatase PhoE